MLPFEGKRLLHRNQNICSACGFGDRVIGFIKGLDFGNISRCYKYGFMIMYFS